MAIVSLDGLNALALLPAFKGNIWAGKTKANIGIFFDERANQKQRDSLNMIFTGKAGGFMAEFAKLIGHVHGFELCSYQIRSRQDDLSYWSAEIPGKVTAKAEALIWSYDPSR